MRYLLCVTSQAAQRAMLTEAAKRRIPHRKQRNDDEQRYLIEVNELAHVSRLLAHGTVHRIDECIRDDSQPRLVDYLRQMPPG